MRDVECAAGAPVCPGMIPSRFVRSVVASLLASAFFVASARAVAPGGPAPPIALPNATGQPWSLAALRGRVVYVDFWASWCTPCRRSFPWMNALAQRYENDGFAIVGVNVDKRRADAEQFLRDVPAAFPVVFDARGAAPTAYDVKEMPSAFLIDRDGVVVAVEEGFHDDQRDAIESRIRALLAKH